jgi:hypothetical protein
MTSAAAQARTQINRPAVFISMIVALPIISALSTVLRRNTRDAKYSGTELLSRKRDRESPRERYFKIPRLGNSDRFARANKFPS